MALIVETGAGASDGEAYISVADCDVYLAARGQTSWAALTTEAKEQAIRKAADYLGQSYRARWAGSRVSLTQSMDWPRANVLRRDGLAAYYPSTSIPVEVVRANAELALRASTENLAEDLDPAVASESVGPISVTYTAGSQAVKVYRAVDSLLRPFLTGTRTSLRLVRG